MNLEREPNKLLQVSQQQQQQLQKDLEQQLAEKKKLQQLQQQQLIQQQQAAQQKMSYQMGSSVQNIPLPSSPYLSSSIEKTTTKTFYKSDLGTNLGKLTDSDEEHLLIAKICNSLNSECEKNHQMTTSQREVMMLF